jgi:hypothetical protein
MVGKNAGSNGEGLMLDLFTQRGGVGLSEPGGEFAVEEEVFLCCRVTYNDYPIGQGLVAFDVRNSLNESVMKKAAVTDENGLATVSFRIPNLLSSNGTWAASSVVRVSESTASDVMDFHIFLHDVAIDSIVPARAWVYQGHSVDVNVTLLNQGFFENVTTALYYNATAGQEVGTQTVILPIGEKLTITFRWNTTGVTCCRSYSMAALASILSEENDPSDNFLEEGIVNVRILGDIDGNGHVNLIDIWLAAQSFAFSEGEHGYNFAADLNLDGLVNLIDMYLTAAHFGQGMS